MAEKLVSNPFKNIQHPHQRLDQSDAYSKRKTAKPQAVTLNSQPVQPTQE